MLVESQESISEKFKMLCVNNITNTFTGKMKLTVGVTYYVYSTLLRSKYCSLYDDDGWYYQYAFMSNFTNIETIRDNKINELLNGRQS